MSNSLLWERRLLPNGLTVLQRTSANALNSHLSVAIRYGSNDDSQDKCGTAHFLEHMLVGGSKERISLNKKIESWGGTASFETTDEVTFTSLTVFPQKTSEAANALAKLLFDDSFDGEKLEIERRVILNEIAEAGDDPWGKLDETLLKSLFKNHPVSNPTLGTRRSVKQLSVADMEEAQRRNYTTDKMILILTGKFTEKDVEAALEAFSRGKKNSNAPAANRRIEQGKLRKEIAAKKNGLTQAYLGLGLRTPPANDADVPALDLANAVLGLGESSRLFVELREKTALTYDFESINMSCLDYGYFSVKCAVKTSLLTKTRKILIGELEKLRANDVPEEELQKSKNLALGEIYRLIDTPVMLPRIMADMEIYFKKETALLDYVNQILALKPQGLKEAANRYFDEKNCCFATVKPQI